MIYDNHLYQWANWIASGKKADGFPESIFSVIHDYHGELPRSGKRPEIRIKDQVESKIDLALKSNLKKRQYQILFLFYAMTDLPIAKRLENIGIGRTYAYKIRCQAGRIIHYILGFEETKTTRKLCKLLTNSEQACI